MTINFSRACSIVCVSGALLLSQPGKAEQPAPLPSSENTRVVETFSGRNSEQLLLFSVEENWALRWEVDTEFPSVSHFNVHLFDPDTERDLGIVAADSEGSMGIRYMQDGGRYYLNVDGRSVTWKIEILDIDEFWTDLPETSDREAVYRIGVDILDEPGEVSEIVDDADQDNP